MSVNTTNNRKDYTGDGVSTTFAYDFRIFANTDFQVYVAGVLKTLTTDYSVTGADNPAGGTVVFVVAPALNAAIALIRAVPISQPVTYPVGNKFPSATHEKALDRLTLISQQINEVFGRALKLKTSSTQKDKDVDDLVALKHLRVKADASGVEMVDIPAGTVAFPITTAQGGLGVDVSASAAKGDLLATNAGLVFSRLARGADGHELNSDSTQALGLSWSIGRIPEHGRLTFVSATQIKFAPFKGTKLPVVTSGVWRLRDIGAGITSASPVTASNYVNGVANQALAASTTYLVTVFDNAGTLTLDFISGASAAVPGTHAPDATTGVEIKTQGGVDNTRTVVGMVRTNASINYQQDNALSGVLSWFNRRGIAIINNFTAGRTTVSTTWVEVNSEIRGNFLTWGDEDVHVQFNGRGSNASASAAVFAGIGIDAGTNTDGVETTWQNLAGNPGQIGNISIGYAKSGLAEGFHYVTVLGAVDNGTATYYGSAVALPNTSATGRCTLSVKIRG